MEWKQHIQSLLKKAKTEQDKLEVIREVRQFLYEVSPQSSQPIDNVQWIPIEKVVANDYNPNSVAPVEMRLLHTSIMHDGYTQPVVTVYDSAKDQYVVVDGFHRSQTLRTNKDIYDACNGLLPCVVIDKDVNDRMASTVRHNRARGKHSVDGMANMVFEMLENGWSDEEICNELGMEAEEIVRLKHITGFSKLFEETEYKKAWTTKRQIKIRKQWENENGKKAPAH